MIQARPAANGSDGPDFIALESSGETNASITANVSTPGLYLLTFRYANGSGPVNTDNKCAVRTLFIDGVRIGPIVMPQRGKGGWANWGTSNPQTVKLTRGDHHVELRLEPYDTNMNGDVNRALIQSLSLVPIDHLPDRVGPPPDQK